MRRIVIVRATRARGPEWLALPLLLLVPLPLVLQQLAPEETSAIFLCGCAALLPLALLLQAAAQALTPGLPARLLRPGRTLLGELPLLVLLGEALRRGQAGLARELLVAVAIGLMLLVPGLALLRGQRSAAGRSRSRLDPDDLAALLRGAPPLVLGLLLLLVVPLACSAAALPLAAIGLAAAALAFGGMLTGHWGGRAAGPLDALAGQAEPVPLALRPDRRGLALIVLLLGGLLLVFLASPLLDAASRGAPALPLGGPSAAALCAALAACLAPAGARELSSPPDEDALQPLLRAEQRVSALLLLVVPLLLAAALPLDRTGEQARTLLGFTRAEVAGLAAGVVGLLAAALAPAPRQRITGALLVLVCLLSLTTLLGPEIGR